MSKQQTAVEYLQNEYKISGTLTDADFNIALEMEKEQIEEAYWEGGQDVPTVPSRCEQYYNETYKQENP